MLKERKDISQKDKWNVESLYPSLKAWYVDYESAIEAHQGQPAWTELLHYQGRLGESAETLCNAFELLMAQARLLNKLYTYVHLRHDEDITNNEHKTAFNKALTALHDFSETISWFEPELLALPEAKLQQLMNDPLLADYRFHLEKIVRMKPHTLPLEQERIMALSARALQTARKAFSALNDADFVFGSVVDSDGKEHTLTHASVHLLGRSQDRTLRKNAFLTLHRKFQNHENTLAELLNGQIQGHLFDAKARNYKSCLEAALYPKNIDLDVYRTLIRTVKENLKPLHRYHDLRAKVLGLDKLHLYDMTVPLTPDFNISMTYDEAEQVVIDSTAPLGSEYQSLLHAGMKNHGWVDRYENKSKRSGAYSSGCYDSSPYILMNFKGLLRDVFTLAHEAGHSMHSLLSHTNQPFQYADYPIFLAEVASTFNEELLTVHLIKTVENIEEKIFLINQKIEDIRGTFFRQVMFAEFELLIHETAEKGQPLTPLFLNESYRKLLETYLGPNVVIDSEGESEWARIPHFYYNFYVYQYATGMSAALALTDKVLKGGKKDQEAYLNFLKSGCSDYPIKLLQNAGVDMHTPEPVKASLSIFNNLVDKLEGLIKSRETVST